MDTLPFSLFGRVAAIKMTILPKLVYLFETLTIACRRQYYILYGPKKGIEVCYKLRELKGDLVVPDILKYWAVQLRRISPWSSMYAYSKWMEIEKLWLDPIHPNSLLGSMSLVKVETPLLGPMLLTREIWRLCLVKFGLSSSMTFYFPSTVS